MEVCYMAEREYTRYQQKAISRFYDNRDQLDGQRLSELVADLYLAEGKKRTKLWETAKELMGRLNVPASRIEHVVKTGDATILAEVVKDIAAGKIAPAPKKPPGASTKPV
jgi:GAF domain-containing protein